LGRLNLVHFAEASPGTASMAAVVSRRTL